MKKEALYTAILFVFVLLISACPSPFEDDDIVTFPVIIRYDTDTLPWDESIRIDELTHSINVFAGSKRLFNVYHGVKANQTIDARIDISERGKPYVYAVAYKDGIIKAEGLTIIDVENGSISAVSIQMMNPYTARTAPKTTGVTGITLEYSELSLGLGDTLTLTAVIEPSNASNKTVTWTSDNESVATVSATGDVYGVSVGAATITVTTKDGGFTAACIIKVTTDTIPVTGVTLNKPTLTINEGVTDDSLVATIIPPGASNKAVTWESNAAGIATVTDGVVYAVSEGTATITVRTVDGGFEAYCDVTVTVNIPVTGVTLNRSTPLPLTVGEPFTLTATVSPSGAINKTVTWSSSDPTVASVTNGALTTLKTGTTTITVRTVDGGFEKTCDVTVYPAGTAGLVVSNGRVTGYSGSSTEVTIPACQGGNFITIIGNTDTGSVFSDSSITSVTIPASVVTIGDNAFGHTGTLTKITFAPDSQLTTIEGNAFWNTSLESVTIPAGVTSIGQYAFWDTDYTLTSVTFMGGTIASFSNDVFPPSSSTTNANNLRGLYQSGTGGAGTYVRTDGASYNNTWTKQATVSITGKTVGGPGGIQDSIITLFNANQDVTVIGTKTDANEVLPLTIPTGITVTWEADYSGSGNISLQGGGDFVLAPAGSLTSSLNGGVINVTGTSDPFTGSIIVKGTITNANSNGHGIVCNSAATIIVDGGDITVGSNAIQVGGDNGTTVIIKSGTLTSGTTISLDGNAKLAILDGTLIATGSGAGVVRTGVVGADNKIYVAGGTIVAGGIMNDGGATGYYADNACLEMFCQTHSNSGVIFHLNIDLFLYTGQVIPWWD